MLVAQGDLLRLTSRIRRLLCLLFPGMISEANLSIDIFPRRCSRILIKRWAVYQSSKSILLEILSAFLLYSRPTQKTSECMLWSKVRLKMFKAKLWICFLLLSHFITYWVAKLSVYQKKKLLFSNCLIEQSKENRIASNSRQVELNDFSKSVRFL